MRAKVNPRFSMLANIDGAQAGLAQRPDGKRSREPKKAKTPEAVTQELVERYLDTLGLPYLHLPAFLLRAAFGRRRLSGPEIGAAREAAEMIRGFPDLAIFDGSGRALFIELKTPIGKLTKAQVMWKAKVGTLCARTFEEAKSMIDLWRLRDSAK